jgi:antitoxin (DNA-binding transcriptional repressor) of toxin-antitoxin stability system
MRIIEIHEVIANFERFVEEAAQGNPFIIAVDGVQKVQVIPIPSGSKVKMARSSNIAAHRNRSTSK